VIISINLHFGVLGGEPPMKAQEWIGIIIVRFRMDRVMVYTYLAIAIIAEVAATSALKASDEFTKLIPSLIVIVGYGASFYLLTLVLRTIPVAITYAIWSGLGIVLVALVGAILYKQIPDIPAVLGMGLIVAGIAIINVFSKTIAH
jgi:small multidrug resistance pump